jgi:peptidoglycan/LPS O-acetylase OafA/YrhL
MVYFLIGILLAVSHQFKSEPGKKWPALITAFSLAVLSKQILIVVITLIILFLLHAPSKGQIHRFIHRLLSNRLTAWMADLSYCVYLLHMLFLLPAAYFLTRQQQFIDLPGFLRFLIVFVATVVPVYLCAIPVFHFLERKGIALGKQIVTRVN